MRFADEFAPSEAELRAWAADPVAIEPIQDWDLVLSRGMEPGRLRLLAELASDPGLPNAAYFLQCLHVWVATVARREDFAAWRPQHARWLEPIGSHHGPLVRRWRHRALRIFQGVDAFDDRTWWADAAADDPNSL